MQGPYFHDIFYKRADGEFSPEIQEKILRDAKEKSFRWWIDHLPGMARERIDMPFEEVLKYLHIEKPVHFVIIHRRGWEGFKPDNSNEWCLEIGFCTLARKNKLDTTKIDIQGDLYLWILLDESHLDYFIKEYNLIER